MFGWQPVYGRATCNSWSAWHFRCCVAGVIGAAIWHWDTAYIVCLILFSSIIYILFVLSSVMDQLRSNRNVQVLTAIFLVLWAIAMLVSSICKSVDAHDICEWTWRGNSYCAKAVISVVFTWCSFVAWLIGGAWSLKTVLGK